MRQSSSSETHGAGFRRRAADRACRDRAFRDATPFGSRFSAREVARDRRADGFLRVPL
jgi:hypothetical protein